MDWRCEQLFGLNEQLSKDSLQFPKLQQEENDQRQELE